MFKLFSKRIKQEFNHFIALDIGTEFVKAVSCELCDNKTGQINGYGMAKLALGDLRSNAIADLNSIIEACNSSIEAANKMAQANPSQIIIGISGDFIKGSTITLKYKRVDPTAKIDQAELKNIIHKIQWKAFEYLRQKIAFETGYNEIDIKLVDASIVEIAIDGYKVPNPIGFQGRELQITIFNAFSPMIHYGALQTIAAELRLEVLAITTEPFSLAKALIRDKEDKLDAIILDVGSSITDLVLIKNGNIVYNNMFTLGGRLFTKRIAQELHISYEEAEGIKLAYSQNKLEKNSYKIIKEALHNDAKIWLSGVEISLKDMEEEESLPSTILLTGGGAYLPEIKEILEERSWTKNLNFVKKPRITSIKPTDINYIKDNTKQIEGDQMISALALANAGLELAREEKLSQSILKKVIRLMQV